MKIIKSYTFSFSPTGSTEQILKALSSPLPSNEFYDITNNSIKKEFLQDELVVVGGPVFGGRMVNINLENIKNLKGNNTLAIAVAVYGNREYDDALLELTNTLTNQGFIVVSAAAFTARHSMATQIAHDRPNADDLLKAESFAKDTLEKISSLTDFSNIQSIKVKGKTPYVKYNGLPLKPKANSLCNSCGVCVSECPSNAIPKSSPSKTDKTLCITCMRCTFVCPQKARDLNPIMKKVAGFGLGLVTKNEKHPEFFI